MYAKVNRKPLPIRTGWNARCSSFRKDQVAKPPWAYFPKTDFSISSAIGVCDELIAGSP